MENLQYMLSCLWELFQYEFYFHGYTFTLWDGLVYGFVLTTVGVFISTMLGGD